MYAGKYMNQYGSEKAGGLGQVSISSGNRSRLDKAWSGHQKGDGKKCFASIRSRGPQNVKKAQ